MYTFLSVGQITDFLLNFNINFLTLSSFEQAVVILLCNIFWFIFLVFVINFTYKFLCRIVRFIF